MLSLRRFKSLRFAGSLTIGVLVGLLLLSALGIVLTRTRNSSAFDQLQNKLLPAQTDAIALEEAYVDQETGQRGYLLTGDLSFLQPYVKGEARAAKLQRQLAQLLGDDPRAISELHGVVAANDTWRSQTAAPQIAQRRQGAIPPQELDLGALRGKQLFDDLRNKLVALTDTTSDMTKQQLATIASNQRTADVVTTVAVVLAVVAGVSALVVLRRFLNRPLRRLVEQVQVVAAGDYDSHIDTEGPEELVMIATAVEAMRHSIVRGTRELAEARERLALSDERDRVAADLHDHSIQRLFGLGLQMSATVARHPELGPTLQPMIHETDEAIKELRRVVFDLGQRPDSISLASGIDEVAGDSVRFLGFSPSVDVELPAGFTPSAADDQRAARRAAGGSEQRGAPRAGRAMSTSSWRPPTTDRCVSSCSTTGSVSRAAGPAGRAGADGWAGGASGAGGDGIKNMKTRAARLGGTAVVSTGPEGGTRVEWRVPMSAAGTNLDPAPKGT